MALKNQLLLASTKSETSIYIKDLYAKFELPYTHKNNEQLNFQFYFGPNDYKILKAYNTGFEELNSFRMGNFWLDKPIHHH